MCGRFFVDKAESPEDLERIIDALNRKGQIVKTGEVFPSDDLPPDLSGFPAADGGDPLRRHLGRAGLVPLVELGSQGDLGADHLDPLSHLPAPAHLHEVAGQAHGMVRHHRGDLRAVHLCGREQAPAGAALLRSVSPNLQQNLSSACCPQQGRTYLAKTQTVFAFFAAFHGKICCEHLLRRHLVYTGRRRRIGISI